MKKPEYTPLGHHLEYRIVKLWHLWIGRRRYQSSTSIWAYVQLWPQGVAPYVTPGTSFEQTSIYTSRASYMQSIKALVFAVWYKKISKAQRLFGPMLNFDPWVWPHRWPLGLYFNKLEYIPLGHLVCKILNPCHLQFCRRRFFNINTDFVLC